MYCLDLEECGSKWRTEELMAGDGCGASSAANSVVVTKEIKVQYFENNY